MKLSDMTEVTLEVFKDGEFESVGKITDIKSPNSLVYIESKDFIEEVRLNENISAVVIKRDLVDFIRHENIGIVVSDLPKLDFIRIHNKISQNFKYGITRIGRNCLISKKVIIPKFGVIIGNNVVIEDNVKIYQGVEIGDNSIIKMGSIIGCDDYERCHDNNGKYEYPISIGKTIIGTKVIISEFTRISKTMFKYDSTQVGDNCYIGRGVDIAHGSKLGSNTNIGMNVTICGYTNIGCNVRIGPSAVISNRIKIDNNSVVTLGSVVTRNIKCGEIVSGNFAVNHNKFINFIKKLSMGKV